MASSRRPRTTTARVVATYHPKTGWSPSWRRTRLALAIIEDLHERGVSMVRVKKKGELQELSISRLLDDLSNRSQPTGW